MKDVNEIISKVLTTPEEFPDCIVVVCKSISNGIVIRKESVAKQRRIAREAYEKAKSDYRASFKLARASESDSETLSQRKPQQ